MHSLHKSKASDVVAVTGDVVGTVVVLLYCCCWCRLLAELSKKAYIFGSLEHK